MESTASFFSSSAADRLSRRIAHDWMSAFCLINRKRFWTGTKIGAITGLIAGFAIAYAAGDDGIFHDMIAGFSGLALGGLGTGAGALAGSIAKRYRDQSEIIYRKIGTLSLPSTIGPANCGARVSIRLET